MANGPKPRGLGAVDPLGSTLFICAALLNLVTVAMMATDGPVLSGIPVELASYAVLHVAWIARILLARGGLARRRQQDLEFFKSARSGLSRQP
jgi:hypothetical protein